MPFSEDGKSQLPPGLTRPARALVGWMPQAQGEMMLQGNTMGAEVTPQDRERARQAREAVEARPAGFNQADLISEPSQELADHIARLQQSPSAAGMFREGWRVGIVDLARVCAFQPFVFTDRAPERIQDIKADDIEAIAAVTLPPEAPAPPRVAFDPARQAWLVQAPNLNLRIVGQVQTAVQEVPGGCLLGFIARVTPSFMAVVHFHDRYLLHDGYNRAFALLDRGITHVPVFTRSVQNIEEAVPPGMLPQEAYLGERPPLLCDYRDDSVAREVRLPDVQKMIIIQGLELNPAA